MLLATFVFGVYWHWRTSVSVSVCAESLSLACPSMIRGRRPLPNNASTAHAVSKPSQLSNRLLLSQDQGLIATRSKTPPSPSVVNCDPPKPHQDRFHCLTISLSTLLTQSFALYVIAIGFAAYCWQLSPEPDVFRAQSTSLIYFIFGS